MILPRFAIQYSRFGLQHLLDDAVAAAGLEGALGRARGGHPDPVEHRLPDAADPDVLLGHVSLVLEPQPGTAAEQERELRQGVARLALHRSPDRHRVVEERSLALLDPLELAQE